MSSYIHGKAPPPGARTMLPSTTTSHLALANEPPQPRPGHTPTALRHPGRHIHQVLPERQERAEGHPQGPHVAAAHAEEVERPADGVHHGHGQQVRGKAGGEAAASTLSRSGQGHVQHAPRPQPASSVHGVIYMHVSLFRSRTSCSAAAPGGFKKHREECVCPLFPLQLSSGRLLAPLHSRRAPVASAAAWRSKLSTPPPLEPLELRGALRQQAKDHKASLGAKEALATPS